jgi:hypothetical protein
MCPVIPANCFYRRFPLLIQHAILAAVRFSEPNRQAWLPRIGTASKVKSSAPLPILLLAQTSIPARFTVSLLAKK